MLIWKVIMLGVERFPHHASWIRRSKCLRNCQASSNWVYTHELWITNLSLIYKGKFRIIKRSYKDKDKQAKNRYKFVNRLSKIIKTPVVLLFEFPDSLKRLQNKQGSLFCQVLTPVLKHWNLSESIDTACDETMSNKRNWKPVSNFLLIHIW